MLAPPFQSEHFSSFLIDRTGLVLTSKGSASLPDNLLSQPSGQGALLGKAGSSFLLAPDGEHVVAFSPVPGTTWALVIEEPWESVVSPLLNISLAAPLALAPALLAAVVALWFGASRVIEPLRRLQQQAGRLADGDYDAIEEPITGIAEIRQLQQTLVGMARRIQAAQRSLRGYIGAVNRAQEDERRRLARDLHDETVQDLIAIDQRLQIVSMKLQEKGLPDADQLNELHQATHRAIQEVRRLSRGLRPIYLEDLGLVPALEMLARDAQRDLTIPVSYEVSGSPRRLPSDAELAVYRIVQEALTNLGRHAKAHQAWVEVGFDEGSLSVSVRDDGVGFSPPGDPSALGHEGHYGIMGMYERAEFVQGNLEVKAAPGSGTTIFIRLPLNSKSG